MPEIRGFVHRLKWLPDLGSVVAYVGATSSAVEAVVVGFRGTDPSRLASRQSQVRLLTRAHVAHHPVVITTTGSAVSSIVIEPYCEITEVIGDAIHGDLFSVVGIGFPPDDLPADAFSDPPPRRRVPCVLNFDVGGIPTQVPVDFARPHLAIVSRLPDTIPIGTGTVRLAGPNVVSAPVPVVVRAGPIPMVRVVQRGAAKPSPYHFVFVANPIVDLAAGSARDRVLEPENRAGYHAAVVNCLRGILGDREDVFADRDAEWRITSVYDPAATGRNSALVSEISGKLYANQELVRTFLADRGETADVAFVMHGADEVASSDTARETVDDPEPAAAGPSFTFDGRIFGHPRRALVPGAAAMDCVLDDEPYRRHHQQQAAMHEFLHAMSSRSDGHIADQYVDQSLAGIPRELTVNKKLRARAELAVPITFAEYAGTTYRSAQDRATARDYGEGWLSYHPERIDPTGFNIMDGRDSPGGRLDRLTYAFVRDRMASKLDR